MIARHSDLGRASPVTLESLHRGLDRLFAQRKSKNEPGEGVFNFDNDSLYRRLEQHRKRGLDEPFWDFLVAQLRAWGALRPNTNAEIRAAGLQRLPQLKQAFLELVGEPSSELPRLETLEWNQVRPLFDIAHDIKGSSTPMFASKLCHFLVPTAYFIWDNKLVKSAWTDYRSYWTDCGAAWLRQSDEEKESRQEQFRSRMPRDTVPCQSFPWATKITEYCQFA
jgi:hypothetical protein